MKEIIGTIQYRILKFYLVSMELLVQHDFNAEF